MIRDVERYNCELSSIKELETHGSLLRDITHSGELYFFNREIHFVTYYICRHSSFDNHNSFKSISEIDLNKVNYWTILDTPLPVKIEIKHSIMPGVLLTITSDGYGAQKAFFPMSLLCMWSNNPSSPIYDENFHGHYYSLGDNKFLWKERPFAKIYSLFKKGGKIAFIVVPHIEKIDNVTKFYSTEYIHVW